MLTWRKGHLDFRMDLCFQAESLRDIEGRGNLLILNYEGDRLVAVA